MCPALLVADDETRYPHNVTAPVMLGTQSAAAAAAALKEATGIDAATATATGPGAAGAVAADEEAVQPLPAAPSKKRGGRGKRASAYPEQDYSVKTGE